MILIIILYVQVNVVDMLNLFAIIHQKKINFIWKLMSWLIWQFSEVQTCLINILDVQPIWFESALGLKV